MITSTLRLFGFALLALTSTACLGLEGVGQDESELVEEQTEALTTSNALTANALTANALTANALTANALTANALTANSLQENELLQTALKDSSAQRLMHYVVSCALPAGEELRFDVGGEELVYEGSIGLAPSWGLEGGTCDEECQGWVSACVLARVNYLGVSVAISLHGDSPALETTEEEAALFTDREATYYGNIFTAPQQRSACVSPGKRGITRVCGSTTKSCVVDLIGECDHVCGNESDDGAFGKCQDRAGNPHLQAVTVFLRPSK